MGLITHSITSDVDSSSLAENVPYTQTHQHDEHGESHHRRPYINVTAGLFDRNDPAEREEHECDIKDEEDDCIPVVLEVEVDVSVTNRF